MKGGGGEGGRSSRRRRSWMTKECRNMRIRANWPVQSKKLLNYTEDGYKI
jgi:hypothetical protein